MALSTEHQRELHERKGVVAPLLKASLIASLVFALSWVRWPLSGAALGAIVGIFIGYGILIAIFSMVIGVPVARLLMRFKARQWWVYLVTGIATGAMLGAVFSGRPALPTSGQGGDIPIDNPRSLVFSPWTRTHIVGPPTWTDYYGSIAFGAVVGGALGFSFWYFHYRGRRGRST